MSYLNQVKYRFVFLFFLAGLFLFMGPALSVRAEQPLLTCTPQEVRPMWWKGKMRATVQTTIQETGAEVTLKKGTRVTVTTYSSKANRRHLMLQDGTHCVVNAGACKLLADACTPGDYSDETKTAFVNSRRLVSQTQYLIWVSTNMQSLNVFTGSDRNWTLIASYPCSTGMVGWETPLGPKLIKSKMRVCHSIKFESYLRYFLNFGGSGIHKWPGGGSKKKLGRTPCSHACVRLSRAASLWCYRTIPAGTRLLVY